LLSTRYLSQKHPDSALIILKKLHARAIDNNDKLSEGQCLQQMGQICYNQGHYAQALEFYLHADKLVQQTKTRYAGRQHGRNGVLYYYNKQLDKSRAMYNKALAIYKQTNNLKGQAGIYGNIGHLYEKHQQLR
jgi:tetratricopeptide (TPR) repeat protein